jgi:hypothetical protein
MPQKLPFVWELQLNNREDGGSWFLWYFDFYLPNYTVSRPRWLIAMRTSNLIYNENMLMDKVTKYETTMMYAYSHVKWKQISDKPP